MKFVVDAQLPKLLSDFLQSKGLDCIHSLELPEKNKTKDGFIARLAAEEQRIVISKDTDFLESYLVKKEPPRLLLVKTGNVKNQELLLLFSQNLQLLVNLFKKHSFIEMTKEEIIVHN